MILLRTTDANLDGALVENALLFVALKIERAHAPRPVRPSLKLSASLLAQVP